MKTDMGYLAAVIGLLCAAPNALAQAAPEDRAHHATPAPPPDIYDPNPGPYSLVTGPAGEIDDIQSTVVTRALAAWEGKGMSAFLLCYRPPAGTPVNWDTVLSSLANVARALKAGGAAAVVISPGRICSAPPHPQLAAKSHVDILGVIRM